MCELYRFLSLVRGKEGRRTGTEERRKGQEVGKEERKKGMSKEGKGEGRKEGGKDGLVSTKMKELGLLREGCAQGSTWKNVEIARLAGENLCEIRLRKTFPLEHWTLHFRLSWFLLFFTFSRRYQVLEDR